MTLHSNLFLLAGVKKASTVIFGLVGAICLNRALGPGLRGEYEFVYNVVVTGSVVLHFGISTIFPSYFRRRAAWTVPTFVAAFTVQFAAYSGGSVVLAAMARDWNIAIWGTMLGCNVLATQLGSLCIVTNYVASVVANTAGVVGNSILLGVLLMAFPGSLTGAYLCFIGKEALIIVACFVAIWRSGVTFEGTRWREMPRMLFKGFVPMLTTLLIVLNYRADVIMLVGLGVDRVAIGLFAVGVQLAEYVWLIPDLFKDVVVNRTASADSVAIVSFSCRAASTLVLPLLVVVPLCGGQILSLFFGEAFREGAAIASVVLVGSWSMIYVKLIGVLWLARSQWVFYFSVLSAAVIVNLVANLLLIPICGTLGAAWATVASYSLAALLFIFAYCRRFNERFARVFFASRSDIEVLRGEWRRLRAIARRT